jgi:hypothetical protein
MRLSSDHIKKLQVLLKELHGLDYTDEQAQEAGMAIMRFVQVKAQRKQQLANLKENVYGNTTRSDRTATA